MQSTRRKKIGIILTVLLVVAVVAALIIPEFIDLNRYNGLITSELEKAMGGKVTLGHLSWGISNGVWLEADGFTTRGTTVFPGDADLSRLYARVSLLPLLSKKVVVDKLLLENPLVALNLAPSQAQGKKVPSAAVDTSASGDKKSSAGSPLPVEIRIEQLKVQNGRIRLEDSLTLPGQKVVYNFADVFIEATNLAPGQEMAFQLALRDEAKLGVGSLKGQGTFTGLTEALTVENPELQLDATLTNLDVGIIKPYLKNKAQAQRLGGSISLEINYKGDFGQHLSAEGNIDLSQFKYTDPARWEKPLPGAETKIAYQISLELDQIKVAKLHVDLGNISLSAAGILQDWRKEPIIKQAILSSDLPLVELIPLVPWSELGKQAGIIRQALAGGGKVTIEELVLPDMTLTKLTSESKDLLPKVQGSIKLSDISVQPSSALPKLEDIAGNLRLEKGVLTATEVQGRLGPLTLPNIKVRATNLTGKPKVSAAAKGPMQLVGTQDAGVEKLLKRYGLKSFSGRAEVDLQGRYDQAKPEQWEASGSLVLEGVKAMSHPAGARLDNLKGRVTLKRKKSLELTVEDLTARVNQSPVELEGKLSGGGTPRLIVDARARAERLNLKQLSELFPALKNRQLIGMLDTNIQVYYPQADAAKTRLNGKVKASGLGFRLPSLNISVTDGDADIDLAGNTVTLKDITLRANDQQLSLSGQVSNLQMPTARLQVQSPDLNLDRLLPATKTEGTASKPTPKGPGKKEDKPKTKIEVEKQADKRELPPFLRKLTAQVLAEATQGQYRGQKFQDLTFKVDYERGVLKSYEFYVLIAGGRLDTKGSADLRNLEHIPFTLEPAISKVRLESVAPLLGEDQISINGPLTITGLMQGRTGSTIALLGSLRGNLDLELGPGRMFSFGPAGKTLAKILSFISVQGILSGDMGKDLGEKGVPYHSIKAMNSFQGGNMKIDQFNLDSPAFELNANGDIDLVKQRINMEADVAFLQAVDKVLGFIPLVGKTAAKFTNMYLNIQGPLEDPKVSLRSGKIIRNTIRGEAKER